MKKRTDGFAILKPAARLVRDYLATPQAIKHRQFIDDLWARISPLDPRSYRGISCIVDGIAPPPDWNESDWLATLNVDPQDPLLKTRLAIGRHFEDDLANTNGHLLFDPAHVQEAIQLAPASEQVEVVRVRRGSIQKGKPTIGYDVGYWGGDHYSIICDSIVTPTWHPPQPEDFQTLAESLASLNAYLLFPTPDEAVAFRSRYIRFPWAEEESYPGEFEVIQIEAVQLPAA
jgi:hypothetical protein